MRRWLARRWMMDNTAVTGTDDTKNTKVPHLRLQPQVIGEERARNLQHEIETWQHRNKVGCD